MSSFSTPHPLRLNFALPKQACGAHLCSEWITATQLGALGLTSLIFYSLQFILAKPKGDLLVGGSITITTTEFKKQQTQSLRSDILAQQQFSAAFPPHSNDSGPKTQVLLRQFIIMETTQISEVRELRGDHFLCFRFSAPSIISRLLCWLPRCTSHPYWLELCNSASAGMMLLLSLWMAQLFSDKPNHHRSGFPETVTISGLAQTGLQAHCLRMTQKLDYCKSWFSYIDTWEQLYVKW